MKIVIALMLLFDGSYGFSKSVTKRNIEELSLKLEQLELRVSLLEKSNKPSEVLKVKDHNSKKIETSGQSRSLVSVDDVNILSEVQKKN